MIIVFGSVQFWTAIIIIPYAFLTERWLFIQPGNATVKTCVSIRFITLEYENLSCKIWRVCCNLCSVKLHWLLFSISVDCPFTVGTFNWTGASKTNKTTCAPGKDSNQPGHPPSLIRVFPIRMKNALVLGYLLSAQRKFWSDWADAQADRSLRWAHMSFCWFVMRRLNSLFNQLYDLIYNFYVQP